MKYTLKDDTNILTMIFIFLFVYFQWRSIYSDRGWLASACGRDVLRYPVCWNK